jgi:hypothetical protein
MLCRNMWNTVQAYRVTPAEIAIRSYVGALNRLPSIPVHDLTLTSRASVQRLPPLRLLI